MLGKFVTFAKERFHPASHVPMIALYVAAHWTVVGLEARAVPAAPVPGLPAWAGLVLLFVGVTAFFLKLRFYDEIKDYEVDQRVNPTRPLVRGLVTHKDLGWGIVVCIAVELAIFALAGVGALVGIALAIGWSLLMYKEFFIRERIRPHLTTYAVSHTVVSSMLSLALFAALEKRLPWEVSKDGLSFSLASWFLFNIFEFGRKTFATSEERDGVESYSKIFGRFGAVVLVLAMAGAFAGLAFGMGTSVSPTFLAFVASSFAVLFGLGVAYAVLNRAPWSGIYRGMSSALIIVVYAGLVAFHAPRLLAGGG